MKSAAFRAACWTSIVTAAALAACLRVHSQEGEAGWSAQDHYTKHEYRIPMRDGVRLFTAVYSPKDTSQTYPFLITRTPYSVAPYGEAAYPRRLGPSEEFEKSGYIFVFQDVRGRYMSEGKFVEMRPEIDHPKSNNDIDESTDTYDTIDWLLKHVPDNNGKAGIWGISYPGFYTAAGMIHSHPALKAASPEAPMINLFEGDDSYHGGAFMLAANFGFYVYFKPQLEPTSGEQSFRGFDYGTGDGYQFYLHMGPLSNGDRYFKNGPNYLWDDQVKHDTYDRYWQIRDLEPHLRNVHCAVLTVGGWFDAEDLEGPFRTYHSVQQHDPGIFNGLVEGPWVHGGWERFDGQRLGRVTFGSDTGKFFRSHILFPFFEQYLKDRGDAHLPNVYAFETGTNVWKQYPSWPPANHVLRTLYFREDGGLSFDAPPSKSDSARSYDQYISDPNRPVPFVGYPTTDVPQEYMDSDQRFAATRSDVLVYETPPLDHDVTIAGPVSPRLFVSTSGTDSDFDVKLIDVYPESEPETGSRRENSRNDVGPPHVTMAGYEQLVRGEPFRGKFRKSFEKPRPFTPGKIEEIDFTMPDVNHTFLRGHRIMVQVQSSWFPLTDRNPQTFENIPDAKPADFQVATERIYRGQGHESGIVVNVLP
ncbi:MAG TPA: CocE/NonD family hydrolase [Candidatus Acidoferrales bacterium]|nr:CocE/NonD family hydrolase [Candidatus Acidoferrales bacterium]